MSGNLGMFSDLDIMIHDVARSHDHASGRLNGRYDPHPPLTSGIAVFTASVSFTTKSRVGISPY